MVTILQQLHPAADLSRVSKLEQLNLRGTKLVATIVRYEYHGIEATATVRSIQVAG